VGLSKLTMQDPRQEFFDNLATDWDPQYTAEDLDRLLHLVGKLPIGPGISILDLGCGTGVLFDFMLPRLGTAGLVTGVDFSFGMTQQARRRCPLSNLTVVDANACRLPFRDSSYDMAISFAAFPHFEDKAMAVREVGRVLRRGASFFIVHLSSSYELAALHHRAGGAVAHDMLPPEKELRRMFAEAHFDEVQIEDRPGLYLASGVNAK